MQPVLQASISRTTSVPLVEALQTRCSQYGREKELQTRCSQYGREKQNKGGRMNRYAVLSVSEQSIPNILFMKKFESEYDFLLIISSKEMEETFKSDILLNFTSKEKNTQKIIVDANDFNDVYLKLSQCSFNMYDHFRVNLTGGTKMGSLAVYEYFSHFANARQYYIPFGRNEYYMINPGNSSQYSELDYRLSVNEYLMAYDTRITNESSLVADLQCADKMYDVFQQVEFKENIQLLLELRKKFIHDKINIEHSDLRSFLTKKKSFIKLFNNYQKDAYEFLESLFSLISNIYPLFDQNLSYKWVQYLTGGWFEEYIYHHIQCLNLDDVKTGFWIENSKVTNEIDVAFTKDNRLYFIECKTSLKTSEGHIANETLYKIDSLSNLMGLSKIKVLFTLDSETILKRSVADKIKQMKVKTLTGDALNPENIENNMRTIFNI